jgi:hypothetical protein
VAAGPAALGLVGGADVGDGAGEAVVSGVLGDTDGSGTCVWQRGICCARRFSTMLSASRSLRAVMPSRTCDWTEELRSGTCRFVTL